MNKVLFLAIFFVLFHHSVCANPKKSKCESTVLSLSSHASRTLSSEKIEALSSREFIALVSKLTPEQIKALPYKPFAALTSKEFIALIPLLTFKKIEALPSKRFVKLTVEQIASLPPKLTPAQLWALLRLLPSRQTIALGFNDRLSHKQIQFLITKLIDLARVWFFEPGKLNLEDIKFIEQIISVIRHSLLSKGETLSHEQMESLPPEFIKAFSSELFGIIP